MISFTKKIKNIKKKSKDLHCNYSTGCEGRNYATKYRFGTVCK